MSDEAKPFAWAVIGDAYEYATLLAEHAGAIADEEGGTVVPLYRSPTLTDAEREAVEWAICSLKRDDNLNERFAERLAETLERLNERLK